MSSNLPINQRDITAPTPQNTPLTHAPIAAGLSRPTVPDITEEGGDENEDSDSAQAGAMKKVLAKMVNEKLKELIGRNSGYIQNLAPEIKRSLVALHAVQEQQTDLQAQFKREVWELERKVLVFSLMSYVISSVFAWTEPTDRVFHLLSLISILISQSPCTNVAMLSFPAPQPQLWKR